MNYFELLAEDHVAILHDWLTELGELFVCVEYPRSGSSGNDYLFRSLEELRELISRQTLGDIDIYIFRAIIFPFRGNDYSAVLQCALREIPEGQYYRIMALPSNTRKSQYLGPYGCECLADGKGHDELRKDIAGLEPAQEIAIGVHPFDPPYEEFERLYGGSVEKLYFKIRVEMHNNLDKYDEYRENPIKYQDVIRRWYGSAKPR